MHTVSVGRYTFSQAEALEIYDECKYIVTSQGIFQPSYSMAQRQVYFFKIAPARLVKRGYKIMTADEINAALGGTYIIA